MKKEQFDKARPIISIIENIGKIQKKLSFGEGSESKSFEEENEDFYSARFFNIKNTSIIKSTGGGSIDLQRIVISEYSDGSGGEYMLSKSEIYNLQNFVNNMLSERMENSKDELAKI